MGQCLWERTVSYGSSGGKKPILGQGMKFLIRDTRDAWVVPSVECPTLASGCGRDLLGHVTEPHEGLTLSTESA